LGIGVAEEGPLSGAEAHLCKRLDGVNIFDAGRRDGQTIAGSDFQALSDDALAGAVHALGKFDQGRAANFQL
jgi:hypothetical protein